MKKLKFALAFAPSLLCHASWAETLHQNLEEITVTAQALARPLQEVGSEVTILTQKDIENTQRRDLSDLLSYVSGLNMVRTAGIGGTGSIFMRGLGSNEVKVRLDGMEINDSSTPNGQFDTSQFITDGLGRVEILKGPQSGLYGADAMAGVIDMTTQKGEGALHGWARIEGGSYHTTNETAYIGGATQKTHYMVMFSHLLTSHYQQTPQRYLNLAVNPNDVATNRNDNQTVNIRLDHDFSQNFNVNFTTHLTKGHYNSMAYAYGPAPLYQTMPSSNLQKNSLEQAVLHGEAHLFSYHHILENALSMGYVAYHHRNNDEAEHAISYSRGSRFKANWNSLIRIKKNIKFLMGYDYIQEKLTRPENHKIGTNALYGELLSNWRKHLFSSLNIRYDHNSRYGNIVTWRASEAYYFPQMGLTLKANGGSGFHGPSLTQLYVSNAYIIANPSLKAEKLRGYDVGFEKTFLNKKITFSSDYYENHVWNLINYVGGYPGTYENVNRAQTYGVEATLLTKLIGDALIWKNTYTWTIAKDLQTKQILTRRPKHKISSELTWQPHKNFTFTPSFLYVSSWHDVSDYEYGSVKSHDYFIVNFASSYKITKHASLFVRGDNIANRHYENPVGYLQPRRSFYGGVQIVL